MRGPGHHGRHGGEGEVGVHVELEAAVGVHVGPEQRGQGPPVGVGEPLLPLLLAQDVLEKQGVDVHQRRLEQVQRQHRDLLGLLVGAGQVAVLAIEQVVVGGVPVLHDPGARR